MQRLTPKNCSIPCFDLHGFLSCYSQQVPDAVYSEIMSARKAHRWILRPVAPFNDLVLQAEKTSDVVCQQGRMAVTRLVGLLRLPWLKNGSHLKHHASRPVFSASPSFCRPCSISFRCLNAAKRRNLVLVFQVQYSYAAWLIFEEQASILAAPTVHILSAMADCS